MANTDLTIISATSDRDLIFKGVDGASVITALTLDMSDAGKATFNGGIVSTQPNAFGACSFNDADLSNVGTIFADQYLGDADTNTGIVLNGSDVMTLHTAGTERIRIDASGNVGIGSSSPLSKMTIAQTSGNTALTFQQTNNGTTNFLIGCQYNVGNAFEITPSTAAGGSTFNSPALVVNSSGNVGIGTTSPSNKLDIVDSTGGFAARITNNNDGSEGLQVRTSDNDTGLYILDLQSSTSATGTNYASQFVVEKGGRVGIGTTSPATTLHVTSPAGSNKSTIITRSSGAEAINLSEMQDYNALQILNKSSGSYLNFAGNASHTSIQAQSNGSTAEDIALNPYGGNVGVGTTSASAKTHIKNSNASFGFLAENSNVGYGTAVIAHTATSGTRYLVDFRVGSISPSDQEGTITSTGSGVLYGSSSDARKKNILGKAKGLEIINKLNPVNFEWKKTKEVQDGLIAQEVLEIVPNAVSGSEEEYYQMDYSKLVTPLIKAIQEQQDQIDKLSKEIAKLKKK